MTQRSESGPPNITPMNEDRAMVIVATGPAHIGLSMLPANSVGSQFFVAQPGRDVEAKKKRMAQKAMFEKMRPKDLRMEWEG